MQRAVSGKFNKWAPDTNKSPKELPLLDEEVDYYTNRFMWTKEAIRNLSNEEGFIACVTNWNDLTPKGNEQLPEGHWRRELVTKHLSMNGRPLNKLSVTNPAVKVAETVTVDLREYPAEFLTVERLAKLSEAIQTSNRIFTLTLDANVLGKFKNEQMIALAKLVKDCKIGVVDGLKADVNKLLEDPEMALTMHRLQVTRQEAVSRIPSLRGVNGVLLNSGTSTERDKQREKALVGAPTAETPAPERASSPRKY